MRQRNLAAFHEWIGDALVPGGDRAGAAAEYRKGLAIRETLAERDPSIAQWQRDLMADLWRMTRAGGGQAYVLRALDIAADMQRRGTLTERDAALVGELRRLAGQ